MNWKKLHTETIAEDWFFRFEKIRYERLADGKIIDPYYLFYASDWINALALTADGQAIMLRQYRPGINQVMLELPGGIMDPGETDPEAAMRRELLEETGYEFDRVEMLAKATPNPALQTNWCYSFLATGGRKVQEQDLDDNEEITIELMPVERLPLLLQENKILQTIHVTTLHYAMQKLGL
jgi:ADP-ribose pyrophosphatase